MNRLLKCGSAGLLMLALILGCACSKTDQADGNIEQILQNFPESEEESMEYPNGEDLVKIMKAICTQTAASDQQDGYLITEERMGMTKYDLVFTSDGKFYEIKTLQSIPAEEINFGGSSVNALCIDGKKQTNINLSQNLYGSYQVTSIFNRDPVYSGDLIEQMSQPLFEAVSCSPAILENFSDQFTAWKAVDGDGSGNTLLTIGWKAIDRNELTEKISSSRYAKTGNILPAENLFFFTANIPDAGNEFLMDSWNLASGGASHMGYQGERMTSDLTSQEDFWIQCFASLPQENDLIEVPSYD